mgnify:CR=1 FL=1
MSPLRQNRRRDPVGAPLVTPGAHRARHGRVFVASAYQRLSPFNPRVCVRNPGDMNVAPTALSYGLVLRPCPTALSYGLALRPCPTALPYGLVLRPCPTALSYGLAPTALPYGLALRPCHTALPYGLAIRGFASGGLITACPGRLLVGAVGASLWFSVGARPPCAGFIRPSRWRSSRLCG